MTTRANFGAKPPSKKPQRGVRSGVFEARAASSRLAPAPAQLKTFFSYRPISSTYKRDCVRSTSPFLCPRPPFHDEYARNDCNHVQREEPAFPSPVFLLCSIRATFACEDPA